MNLARSIPKVTRHDSPTNFLSTYQMDLTDHNFIGYCDALRHRLSQTQIESVSQLDEVVVTGYGVQLRSNISGSVSSIDAEDIAERPILRVEQALQGRAAGVQVAQVSGSPGSALTVRVRGVGTINNSDPLYIVDGIPVEGLDFLNPNDIESINVLKDAASAPLRL